MSLEANWRRIIDWCEREAPITASAIRSADPPDVREKVEEFTGRTWPEELRSWFALHGGSGDGQPFAGVLPGYRPLSLPQVAEEWRSKTSIWAPVTKEFGWTSHADDPAGTTAFTFLPAFVPFAANGSADSLVVDTRSGDRFGCVVGFFNDGADEGSMAWASLADMLDDTALSLESGRPCHGYVPHTEEGQLFWDFP